MIGQQGSGHYPPQLGHIFSQPMKQQNKRCAICKEEKESSRIMWISAGHLSPTGMLIASSNQCEDCTPQGSNPRIDDGALWFVGIDPNSWQGRLCKSRRWQWLGAIVCAVRGDQREHDHEKMVEQIKKGQFPGNGFS